ncbi:hypothetical protein AcW1_005181 [Taiwanofungus camphoratus]|nr:hypothetical protein AcW2_003953 [Antrodia cinnamomea]KAI0948875.1 hypothetical protein AcV7_009504 [Antrodia cinnamomea]KAI0956525.1 hypothetical protein AcW1_005181 [Antrodia cinnamomea]
MRQGLSYRNIRRARNPWYSCLTGIPSMEPLRVSPAVLSFHIDSPPSPTDLSFETAPSSPTAPVTSVFSPSTLPLPTESRDANTRDHTRPTKHEMFYFQDVVFLIEGTILRLTRYPFENNSKVFRDMYMLPVVDSSIIDGSSDEHPLVLEGVEKAAFEQLLRVLYPPWYYNWKEVLSVDQWKSVLNLADMWQFDEVRAAAISALAGSLKDPVQRIALAQRYGITSWLLPSLNQLAQRGEPLGLRDAEQIGIDFALRVASVRECFCGRFAYRGSRGKWSSRPCRPEGRLEHDFSDRIQQVFFEELSTTTKEQGCYLKDEVTGPIQQSPSNSQCKIKRHMSNYDCHDTVQLMRDISVYSDYVVFLVESVLFRVTRYPFENNNKAFCNSINSRTLDNTSDEHPLTLEDVTTDEFEQLLRLLYPRQIGKEEILSADQWISVLKLADRWQFDAIRDDAIGTLRVMLNDSPAQRIALAQQYKIRDWFVPALNQLAQREEPLQERDVDQIGLAFVLKLAEVRESFVQVDTLQQAPEEPMEYGTSIHRKGRSEHDFTETIEYVFRDELQDHSLLPVAAGSAGPLDQEEPGMVGVSDWDQPGSAAAEKFEQDWLPEKY